MRVRRTTITISNITAGEYSIHVLVDGEDIRDSPFVVQIVEPTAMSPFYRYVYSEVSVEGVQQAAEQQLLEKPPRVLARVSCEGKRIKRDVLCISCYEESTGRPVSGWELEPECQWDGGARTGTPQVVARARPEAAGRHVLYVTYEYTNTGQSPRNTLGSPYRVRSSVSAFYWLNSLYCIAYLSFSLNSVITFKVSTNIDLNWIELN